MAHVLVVDDRATNRDYISTLLGYCGHSVVQAVDGVHALELIGRAPPDLVITDMLMPNMDGEELARRLRATAATRRLPVIFHTAAYHARAAGLIAEKVGVRWVLAKPAEPQDIIRMVNEALGGGASDARTGPETVPGDDGDGPVDQLRIIQSLDQRLNRLVADNRRQSTPARDVLNDVHELGLRLTSLIKLGFELSNEREPAAMVDLFCRAAQDILGARYVGVVILAPHSRTLSHFASRGLSPSLQALLAPSMADCAAARRVLGDRRSVRMIVASQQGDTTGLPPEHPPVQNFLACAVVAREDASGWMYVADQMGGQGFSADDERVIRALCAQLGSAWEAVTLYQELDQRVTERTQELEMVNRQLESFSYSVSHDLRSPLQRIDGFARALEHKHGAALPDEAQRYLASIQRNARQMDQLIADLFNFARLAHQPLDRKPVSMRALVKDCLTDFAEEIERRHVDVSVADVPDCKASPLLLRQVLVNLLGNAIKYTRRQAQPVVELGFDSTSNPPAYFIRDNGAGFDMAYARDLFGLFRRLHSNEEFEGTGIGLASVQQIINRHGGRVWAQAEVGKGATFHFTLPMAN
ncbi:MAG: ATP-binding protein [Ramlibacter sp.]